MFPRFKFQPYEGPKWECRAYAVLFVFLALACFYGGPARAADPECVDPVVYDPAIHGQYNATQAVRFCTPEEDVAGYLLLDGELTRCVVSLAGRAFAITSTNRPGQYVNFDTPDSVKQATSTGEVRVHCETAAGPGAPAVALNARFRDPAAPGSPVLYQY